MNQEHNQSFTCQVMARLEERFMKNGKKFFSGRLSDGTKINILPDYSKGGYVLYAYPKQSSEPVATGNNGGECDVPPWLDFPNYSEESHLSEADQEELRRVIERNP